MIIDDYITPLYLKVKNYFHLNESIRYPKYANKYLQVYSHPRSGTHFLEAFIAQNFYSGFDLEIKSVEWGHWASRKLISEGNKYGKLFGSHVFPRDEFRNISFPLVYIYRDGRAVAYSIWKTQNFINPKLQKISLSDFLRTKIDWIGSPAFQFRPKMTIAEHWSRHVEGWLNIANKNLNVLPIKYEDLINQPYEVYINVHERFFSTSPIREVKDLKLVKEVVGLLPNQGRIDSWKGAFRDSDIAYFQKKINPQLLG